MIITTAGIAWIENASQNVPIADDSQGHDQRHGTLDRRRNNVLIENMGETIEAVLANVVGRRLFKKGRSMHVKLREKVHLILDFSSSAHEAV